MADWQFPGGLGFDGRVDQVLLDEPNMCFPDPTDVAFTPDGRTALVTSSGSNRVAVVDVARLVAMLKAASPHEREHVLPNHLGKPTEFVTTHVTTGASPRGVVVTPDGTTAFVANALDDSLTVIDVKALRAVGRIDLGGPKVITTIRRGERIFHSARNTFNRQFSCHSCHPDGHVDGLTYDIEPTGLAVTRWTTARCGAFSTRPPSSGRVSTRACSASVAPAGGVLHADPALHAG